MSLDTLFNSVTSAVKNVVFGQDEAIELSLAALFSGGHVLLEGPPGTAKTLLVRAIAATLKLDYRRVQMTPDLLPGDITGSSIYRQNTGTFEFVRGPVFTNFLLADEVNRASARTQAAMLEAMQELAVTHDGLNYPLPRPFVTFATENPIEQEGTYPLPWRSSTASCSKSSSAIPTAKRKSACCANTMRPARRPGRRPQRAGPCRGERH